MIISPMKVTLIDSMGSDLSIVNAARVSFHKESEWEYELAGPDEHGHYQEKVLSEKDKKLVSYLAKHGHWSPFAHAFLSFRIKAPIFVARQLVKHQVGLAWNEVSRRYVDDEPEYFLPSSWRSRPENGMKQGSSDVPFTHLNSLGFMEEALEMAHKAYTEMVAKGCAPEQARMVLPQNTMTEWIWSGSLAAFARVVKLRVDPHAQAETREVAQLINDLVPPDFEHSWKALIQ